MEAEITQIAVHNSWAQIFAQIRRDSMNHQFNFYDASKPENRALNRYRDVYPYDHSRVILKECPETDYINASIVRVPKARRAYILAQGPLSSTVEHFWLMVWEQKTRAVLMLNRVFEKGQLKCHQYWPLQEGKTLNMNQVHLRLEHVETVPGEHYTVRTFRLSHLETEESREILHFHYTTWPDFGVPQCPDSFLRFLQAVRDSGSLEDDVGPPVVHCSAGIGRSGSFCLVDTCLVLIEREGAESVCIKDVLLEMRTYRMGLIQTPDQLKFSYLAIAEGAKQKGLISLTDVFASSISENESTDSDEDGEKPPLPPPRLESLNHLNSEACGAYNKQGQVDLPERLHENPDVDEEEDKSGASSSSTSNVLHVSHPKLMASVSAPPLHDSSSSSTSATKTDLISPSATSSPTKCILNNHKMEERKRRMELRRKQKEEKMQALEEQILKMKKKSAEADDRHRRRQFLVETIFPFCVGLAMALIGTYFYVRS